MTEAAWAISQIMGGKFIWNFINVI
jgi:hypothetical protein